MLSEKTSFRFLDMIRFQSKCGRMKVRGRSYAALSFRLKGKAQIRAGALSLTLGAGDVLFMPDAVSYDIRREAEDDLLCFHFYLQGDGAREPFAVPAVGEEIADLFWQAYNLETQKSDGWFFRISAILYEILYRLHCVSEGDRDPIAAARSHIDDRFSSPALSVASVAEEVGVSVSLLRLRFRERYGTSPREYLIRVRLDHAKILLEGELPVKEVAARSGFSDVSEFCAIFRKKCGVSPGKYHYKWEPVEKSD